MIDLISWEEILRIWRQDLWPDRISPIEPTSAMNFLDGYDLKNQEFNPSFFGYFLDDELVGVNSGHRCDDGSYRSRGLFVYPVFRKKGIARQLLTATINQAIAEDCGFVWSFPRKSSWTTYQSLGFSLSSQWQTSETNEANAFCYLKI